MPALAAADFRMHVAASGVRFGYQVAIADINGDDRPDLIGLGAQMTELYWYENPTWEAHLLIADVSGMINVDALDVDGDGIPELALAYGFSTIPARSSGDIAVLSAGESPEGPWELTVIDQVPTAHRIRWALADDDAAPVLVVAPILSEAAQNQSDPDRLPTPLFAYAAGQWARTTITDENVGAMHGILVWDRDNDGADEILTAGRLGIHSHRFTGATWERRELSAGVEAPYPDGGASDVAAGVLDDRSFLAAIEPFHGNEVVVYPSGGDGLRARHVIDTGLINGHTILTADVTGDADDEIVAAGSRGREVYLYRSRDASGAAWERTVIDDDISANSCAAGDLNGDGRIDIACIDARPPNDLRWYENLGNW